MRTEIDLNKSDKRSFNRLMFLADERPTLETLDLSEIDLNVCEHFLKANFENLNRCIINDKG